MPGKIAQLKALLASWRFSIQHPQFLTRRQEVALASLLAFLILLILALVGLLAWERGRKATPFARAEFSLIQSDVLGEQASESGKLAEASKSAQREERKEKDKEKNREGETPADQDGESEDENTPAPSSPNLPRTNITNRINFPVNKFGIHAFAGVDQVELASQLVNSNGGDWGWITLTMNINHRDQAMWNGVFSACRQQHLIPIIQLSNDGKIPSDSQLEEVANFLHSLTWPTKLRFVSVFNEVNASEYWGGEINPEKYAQTLNKVIDLLRGANPDFFIMNGAFNASARTGHVITDLGVETSYLSEDAFLQRMNSAVPGIFAKLDGWASHCYPHPAYTSHPLATATPTLRDGMSSYKWELALLQNYGAGGLPVFITETGWPHQEGQTAHPEWHNQNTVAEYYKIAMRDLYGPDGRVVAVAPFILKYDGYDNFAFVKPDGSFYPQWEAIQSLPKIAGSPPLY